MLELDGHVVPATQREFLAALGGTDRRGGRRGGRRPRRARVLILDTFELLAMLDHWLCRMMLPALPSNVRVVIAGRNAPFERWRSYGPLLCSIPLGNLSPEEADELLRRNGVDAETAPRINAVAHGHPLSLQLAAWALRDRPGLAIQEIAAGTVGEELARVYLDGLDAPTRRALNAAALTRRTTLSLLAAMLPDEPADRGLRPPARAAVRGADRGRAARPRHRARGHRRAAARRRPAGVLAAARRRLELPARRAARRPPPRAPALHGRPPVPDRGGGGAARVLPRRRRRAARRGPRRPPTCRRWRPSRATRPTTLRAWWAAVPDAFIVACKGTGAVAGFACLAEPGDVSPRVIDGDPLASRWRAHLRSDPSRAASARSTCAGSSR